MRPRTTKWSLANLLGRSRPPVARQDTTYHAVCIVPGEQACEAARRFAGQRLLSRQAPPCRCRRVTQHSADAASGITRTDAQARGAAARSA